MRAAARGSSVAIAGAGLAGLAAACALADKGLGVTLFERRPFVGGRASSYQHPGTGEVVDNCQHVLLGCCTNLMAFYRRLGVEKRIRWYDRLTFVEPGGRRSEVGASWLPAPFHVAPSFLATRSLSLRDKLIIARTLLSFLPGLPQDTDEDFLTWLRHKAQTERAVNRFWKVVLVSALNEELGRLSVHYAAQVFRESFLKSAQGGRMGVPSVPLTELYNAAVDYLRQRGGEVRLRAAVESFRAAADGVRLCVAGEEINCDFAVLALPPEALRLVLPDEQEAALLRSQIARVQYSPITGIHLWFDREITDLPHAVLLDRTIQWMFNKSKLLGRSSEGSYLELVVSSSKSLVERSRQEIVDLARHELAQFFPAAREAKLVKSTVVKEIHATASPQPGLDACRPLNMTAWPRVFLAGDWTATRWPATMEGAVRSGLLAAEALVREMGQPAHFLAPDLPAAGLMKVFG